MTRKLALLCSIALTLSSVAVAHEAKVLRSRMLEAKPQTLRAVTQPGETMPLRLFEDASYVAVLEDIYDHPRNGLVWRGHLAERFNSWVLLVEHRGVMAGVIATGDRIFRVRYVGAARHVIEEMNPRTLRWRGNDAVIPDLASEIPPPVAGSGWTTAAESTDVEIDVLMVYTRKAAKRLVKNPDKYWWVDETDKTRAIESQARLSIAVANAALANSRVKAHFRIVGIKKIKGRSTKDYSLDLDRLAEPDDGFFDDAHAWRDQLGADFVVGILGKPDSDAAGVAYVIPAKSPSSPELAFSVVYSPALWWTTVAHEIGHNMGLVHNPENDSAPPAWRSHPYARGYRDEEAGLATLMSYTDGCDKCWNDIPHYSNPRVKWKGKSQPSDPELLQPTCRGEEPSHVTDILFPVCGTPTGTADFNAARSIKKNRAIFANHRDCRVDCQGSP